MKAIILSAGRGERLRPLTDTLPKPLIEINGKSLIEYHLEKLAQAGVTDIVINHAWLGQKIEQKLGKGVRYGLNITYSPEPEGGLETAGGIINALDKLSDGNSPFLVINGDVFTDYDFKKLTNTKLTNEKVAHLILVKNPDFKEVGDFGLENGQVNEQKQYTFSGISIIHPRLFKSIKLARLKLAPILRQAIKNKQIQGSLYQGYWSDIGTVERLEATAKYLQGHLS